MEKINLKDRLLPNEAQSDELEVFLTTYFSQNTQREPNKINFGGDLIVEYNKKNTEIKSIYVAEGGGSVLLNNLEKEAREALSLNQGTKIDRVILFNQYSTKGHFRLENDFQISPVPDENPQPEFALANHPFVLEYAYPNSCNRFVRLHRSTKRQRELMLLLNAFLRGGVATADQSASYEWVLVPSNPDDPKSIETKYLQKGYWPSGIDAREKDKYGFSTSDIGRNLETTPSVEYYTEFGFSPIEVFRIPDNFQVSFKLYNALSADKKRDFLRASHWKKVSSDSFQISQSSAYIALVNAIESLVPPAKSEGRCSECGKEKGPGPTKNFRGFLEKYTPGVPSEYRNELYRIRSKFTHGGSLMPGDMAGKGGFRFNPGQNEIRNKHYALSHIVQVALISWLHSNGH